MKWLLYFSIVSVGYVAGMTVLVREWRSHTSEERYQLQTGPIMIGASALFLALVRTGVRFCFPGLL